MKAVIISGTPGTGKTTLSKKLAKRLGFHYTDVNKLISGCKLSESYDIKRKTKIVDTAKLNKELIKEINTLTKKNNKKFKKIKGIIIDSHLSHYLSKKYVDLCIITKCDIKELNKRLRKKYFNREKIKENLEAEIFDVCLNEAMERKHKIITIDTTKGFNIDNIIRKLGA